MTFPNFPNVSGIDETLQLDADLDTIEEWIPGLQIRVLPSGIWGYSYQGVEQYGWDNPLQALAHFCMGAMQNLQEAGLPYWDDSYAVKDIYTDESGEPIIL